MVSCPYNPTGFVLRIFATYNPHNTGLTRRVSVHVLLELVVPVLARSARSLPSGVGGGASPVLSGSRQPLQAALVELIPAFEAFEAEFLEASAHGENFGGADGGKRGGAGANVWEWMGFIARNRFFLFASCQFE